MKDLNNLPYLVHFNSVLNCLVVFKLWLGTAFFRLCFLEQISHTLLFLICLGFLDRRRIGWGKGEHSHAHHGGGGGEAVVLGSGVLGSNYNSKVKSSGKMK